MASLEKASSPPSSLTEVYKMRDKSRAGGRAFTHAESGGTPLERIEGLGSAMEWRGVRDKPEKEREARMLPKKEQSPYSGCEKALPPAPRGLS